MATVLLGPIDWNMSRDEQGHRTYRVAHLVRGEYGDGPAAALLTPGLPVPGNVWAIGTDTDLWAWCRQDATVSRWSPKGGEKGRFWKVEQTFSTKPNKKCSEYQFEDPLTEPQRVSGSFIKFTEEATTDFNGNPIKNSAWEPIRGPNNEWDGGRPQVTIEQNVLNLELPLLCSLIHTLNEDVMWGLPARCVKLSEASWEKKYRGFCYVYYTRRFTFDIRFDTFDRNVLDEGTKALRGKWDMRRDSPTFSQYVLDADLLERYGDDEVEMAGNPANFIRYKDPRGENGKTILNGAGRPFDPGTITTGESGTGTGADTEVGYNFIQKYDEANLFLLGVPVDLTAP